MPITLITGTPGAGKSLYALWEVENRRKKENRDVYYSGIADLLLPWTLFGAPPPYGQSAHNTDPSDWHKLPNGCIIVMDEAQRLFRPRALGGNVPLHVSELETHRHRGMDIYIITQHPGLIDSNVRKLTDAHKHLMRKFGSKWATVHEWKGVRDNCDKSRKDSIESEFRYPKEVFKWYKSAEVHTVRFKLPMKVLVLLCLPLVLAVAVWFAYRSATKLSAPPAAAPSVVVLTSASGQPLPVGPGPVSYAARALPALTQEQYVAQFQPRIDGLYHTAPRYDALTVPVRAPVPVGCVLYEGDGAGSFCVTQQGTRFVPPMAIIKSFIDRGFFRDFDGESRTVADNSQARPVQSQQPPSLASPFK